MARNKISKVFDFEGSLETGSKEPAKWRNERCKKRQRGDVELKGANLNNFVQTKGSAERAKDGRDAILGGDENVARFTSGKHVPIFVKSNGTRQNRKLRQK